MHLHVGRVPVEGRGRGRVGGGKIRSAENGEMLSFLASPLYSKMLEMKHIFFFYHKDEFPFKGLHLFFIKRNFFSTTPKRMTLTLFLIN